MSRIEAFFFLCRCLCGKPDDPPTRQTLADEIRGGHIVWERVIEISSEYMMTVALYFALAEKELLGLLPADLIEYFETIRDLNRARNRGIVNHTLETAALLNRIGVEPLVFKGASHLISGLYPDPAMRIMHDIDILVPEDRAGECREYMQAAGYREVRDAYESDSHFHCPALRREGRTAAIELHHRSPWPQLLSVGRIYEDSHPAGPQGVHIRVPSATHGLVIVAAHAYVQHQSKRHGLLPLRDLYDTAVLTRKKAGEIDWRLVARTFDDAGKMDALRMHSMMLERLLGQRVSGVTGRPRSAFLYWRLCLLGMRDPAMREIVARLLADLGDMFRNTENGRRVRKELLTPSTYSRKLRGLRAVLRGRAGGLEDASKS